MIITTQLKSIIQPRLTRSQYVSWLGQHYHVAVKLPDTLRMAADHLHDPPLVGWLRQCAAREQGLDRLILQDLDAIHSPVPAPTGQTRLLVEQIRLVAASDQAHRVLGLASFWDHRSRTIASLQRSLPEELGVANAYLRTLASLDTQMPDVQEVIRAVSDEQRGDIHQQMRQLASLYASFHHAVVPDAPIRPEIAGRISDREE